MKTEDVLIVGIIALIIYGYHQQQAKMTRIDCNAPGADPVFCQMLEDMQAGS